MFRRCDYTLHSDPVCDKPVLDLAPEDFLYYDKDGFELNLAEQKYYQASGHPLNDCLNHLAYQQTWFVLTPDTVSLILDHCLILHRCRYDGEALRQLKTLRSDIPQADFLINTQSKWGMDLALDAIAEDGTLFEVLHIEHDSKDYRSFQDRLLALEYQIRHMDWYHAAAQVWTKRDSWQGLTGFEQNHWKAHFLLGWRQAEHTEKSL